MSADWIDRRRVLHQLTMVDLAAPPVRLAAYALLSSYYATSGGTASCGPLSTSPDADMLILGACIQVCDLCPDVWEPGPATEPCHPCSPHVQADITALLFFARYTCAGCTSTDPGGCTFGVKLLGTARSVPGTDPSAGQVDQVAIAPSVVASAAGRRRLAAGEHLLVSLALHGVVVYDIQQIMRILHA